MKDNFLARYYHNLIFGRRFPLSSTMNSKSVSVYELNFLNMSQNLFSVKFTIMESFTLSFINFDKYFSYCIFHHKLIGLILHLFLIIWSDLNPRSCLYFQGFWGSTLLNGCLVVWPNNLWGVWPNVCEECNNFQDSKLIFMISDFKIFPIMNCGALPV